MYQHAALNIPYVRGPYFPPSVTILTVDQANLITEINILAILDYIVSLREDTQEQWI